MPTGHLDIAIYFYDITVSLYIVITLNSVAATEGVLWEKVFLETSKNSQENTYTTVSLRPATLLKWRIWHRFFLWILQNF